MKPDDLKALIALPVILGVGALVAWAGSHEGMVLGGWPIFALCAAFAFVFNWLVFVPSYAARSDRFYDLTGSITYATLVLLALIGAARYDDRALLLTGLVIVWAARLGTFLFIRINRGGGEDKRFREIKKSFVRFLMAWTLQGLWALLSAGCALAAITSSREVPLDLFALVGGLMWLVGFAFESIADWQKSAFNSDPENEGRFIDTGLWAWSRHPNYFGEILLWTGVAVIAFPALVDWQLATLISPLFVYVLLTRISGIPLLERRGRKKYGHLDDYQQYLDSTNKLWPTPPKSSSGSGS